MEKSTFINRICIYILFVTLISCKDNQLGKIQGVYKADKESIKGKLQDMGTDNALASVFLNKVIENAVIELQINGDSIKGILFLAGQTNSINEKIGTKNDTLFIESKNGEIQIIPNDKGFLFDKIQMIRSTENDLSIETKSAMEAYIKDQKELKEFTESIGKWKKGYFVDEFGDNTGEGYPMILALGSHETSTTISSDVYVKGILNKGEVYFSVFNKSLSYKENFPESKYGSIKIKYPNGDVKNERVFFFKNSVFESPEDKNPLIYNYLMSDETREIKILIDLSTANSYYSDKYTFSLQKGNLDTILAEITGE